jgi:hypothetical protein
MTLKLVREVFGAGYTAGKLYIDGKLECSTMEDTYRPTNVDKVYGKTCIPFGQYRVTLSPSGRFERDMPLLTQAGDALGVVQEGKHRFTQIRIHSGNTDADTDGCILVGQPTTANGFIAYSKKTFDAFLPKLKKAIEQSPLGYVELTIVRA